VQLNPHDGAKGIRCGQQQSAAHACAEIDKCVCVDWCNGPALPPTHQDSFKDRRRNRIVGRHVPIVPVPRMEMAAGDQPTGAHAKFQIEGVADQAIFDRQTRQEPRLCGLSLSLTWRANAHA
jgi:hypothetical protein